MRQLFIAKRKVVERCLFGVDVNPMAVELAKLALWLETVAINSPLAFLDHHLQAGDSLIGARISQLDSLPGTALITGIFKTEIDTALPSLLEPLTEIGNFEDRPQSRTSKGKTFCLRSGSKPRGRGLKRWQMSGARRPLA